ncbi:hypothetical protein FRB90_011512 [Tulasnella sp. 427]|nr:hypothetical protein FRB90_011512 [Tulasnella sp. 427]
MTSSGTTPQSSSNNEPTVVSKDAIRTNLHARVSYLVSFIGFSSADAEALQAVAPHIRPHLPGIGEAMYNKMWSFDVTRQSLTQPNNPHIPRNADLSQARERMRYMTSFQGHWLLKIFIADWEDLSTFAYFDRVGLSHIGESAFRHRGERGTYQVDYVHIGLLLGHLTDLLTQRILQLEQITMEEKIKAISALTKAMWIQNDLISRHYVMPVETINPPPPVRAARGTAVDINAEAERCPFGGAMYSSASSTGTIVPNPHTQPTNPPGYNPRYAEEEYVEEPWPDESDSDEDDGPNPWANGGHDDGEAGSASEGSEDDYGEQTVVRRRQGEEGETATESPSESVGSLSAGKSGKGSAVVDPKVMDAVTGKFRAVDLGS